ncbi:MAG: Ig-like domain-containing protein, partial [Pseudomonadota bacterium]
MKKESNVQASATQGRAGQQLMRALEPRIMFDAAVMAVAVDAAEADVPASYAASNWQDLPVARETLSVAPALGATESREIVVIDTSLAGWQSLRDGVPDHTEIILIQPGSDGLQQLADALQGETDIDAIHVLSHGDVAEVRLGDTVLNSASAHSYSATLASIGQSLSNNGDIFLYGCYTAQGAEGRAFLGTLATLTGADIAASSDMTASAARAGNWQLEETAGEVTTTILAGSAWADYTGVLTSIPANVTINFNSSGFVESADHGSAVFTQGDFTITYSAANWFQDVDDGQGSSAGLFAGAFSGPETITIQTTSGNEFDFTSFYINVFGGGFASVEGFRDVGSTGTQTTGTGFDQTAGTYTVSLDSSFDNVDRVVITSNSSGFFDIVDSFVLNTANNPPAIANLNGDSVAWAGVGGTVVLDASTNASLTDTELQALNSTNGNWSGANLTVQRSTAVSADTFGFNLSGALFTVSGNNLQSSGQTFATYTNTGGILTVNFANGGAIPTTALVNDVARHINYQNDTPAGDATIRFTLNDGTVAGTVANVTVTSDSIYVTNTSDVSTIDASNGVGLREAVTIGAADVTGSQSIIFSSALASQTITLGSTLTLGESLTLNTDAASTVTITGSTLSLSTGTLSFANGSGDTATINSIVAGTGGLSASGAGTLILGSTSNNGGWSGAVSVTGGTLNTDTSSRLSSGTLTLDGATLAMTVSGAAGTTTTFANAVVLGAGGGTIDIGGGAGANIGLFSGLISGSGSLTKTAAAILQLNGNNNYTGATNLSAGTLIVNHANALGTTAGGTTVTSGASARIAGGLTVAEAFTISGTGRTVSSVAYGALHLISGSSTLSGSVTLAADANISAASGASLTLSAVLGGSAALNKTDTGSLVLSSTDNESEYAGGITVTAGTLSISNDDQLSSGTISLSGGTLAITGATTINNSINLTSSSTIDNSANATLSGVISGANTLTKAGASTLTLSNTNSYAATTVSAGTLSVASDGNLGSGSVALVNGTTLAITGATTIDNAITLAGSTTISSSAAATLSGGISGSGSLGKSGASTLTLSGANAAHSGAITINAGTLSIGGDSNLGSNSVTLAGGTTLAITTGGTIDNNLTLAGAATMQVAAATTWSGVIGGSNNLAKTGASTLTLSNTNTLSGTITVSAGTLAVTGTTSTTTVASGATLTGTGTVDGPVTVQSGGTLSPGSSPGTLTINGDLAMDSGSTLAVEINGTTAGTDYDQVIVNGTVDVSGATLSVTHGYVAGSGDAYNIIVNDAADAVTGSFSGLSEGSTLTAGGNSTVLTTSYIGATGNDFTLTAPINDTPVIGNLNGDSQAWAGVGNTLNLDASANATISDTELNALDDWAGASLIIQRAGTAVSADTFDFNTSGAPFTVNGSTIESGGTPFATFTNSGGVLTISFTSSGTTATTALVQELVQRITYRNDTPAGDATIRFTLSDGSASTTADVTVSTDSIYVTNTTDTATINLTNGVSFSEAIAIAAADATGSQTIVFDSSLAGQTVSTSSASSLGESVTVDLDSASGVILTGGTLSIGSGFGLTVSNGTSDTASIATTLSGAGNFIKAGAGKATLSGTNNFTGTTTVSGGTLAVSGDGNLGSAAVVLNSGTTLQVTGSTTIDNAFTLSGSASIQTDSVVTLSGLLSGGAVTLTKTGGSRLTLSNTGNEAAFTGAMTVTAGTLAPTSDNSLGAGVITLNGGALSSTSGSVAVSIDNLFVIGASGGTLAASTQTLTLTGDISGSGTLSKANSQQLTLSGNNTFTGGLTVAGTNGISIADGTNLGSGTVSLNGALFTVTGSGVTITNAIVLNLDSTVSNANAVTFSGGISGGSTLTKAGAGTLTLSGANSGAWSALVTDGTLAISAANNLGSGTLSLDGGALEITGSSFFTLSNNIDLTGAGTIIATGDASLNGDISGAGTLTKTGLALFTLGGNNTYTGATIISAGALVLDVDTALGSTAAGTTVSSGATLQLSEGVTTADALTLSGAGIGVGGAALYSAGNSTISGTVTLAADTSINISNSCTQTLSNVVSGGFGLTKLNLGTLILSNINTYTGATNVSGGTLSVTGSTVSATTVGSGGTLKGTGTVGGAVTVQSGGTLAPGVSGAGTLTLGNSLTIQSGGTLAVDIAGTTAGTGYDVVAVTGTVDVSSATISTTHSYTPGTGDTYTIITNNAVDAITGTFSGLSEGATLTAGGNSTVLTASYIGGTGNDFSLTAPVNPTVTSVTSAFGDGTFGVGDAVTIIVSFSEVVVVNTGTLQLILETGTTNQTLSYSGGSGGSNLIFTYIVQAGDTSLDLDYLSTAALNLNGDSVQSASFIDAVLTLPTPGTAGSLGANQNIVVDGVRPTASIVVADTALAAGETSTVTITFSEAVTGLTSSDFTVENGVLSGPITSDGGVTWTATLTPTVSTTDTGNLITLDNTGVVDAADNTGTGTTDSNNYAIDTLRPTASIVVADTALAAGETSLVTITFNEAVTGLAIGDFTVAEGVLSGLITGNGGVTWTATLTPTASITDTSNLITLDNTDVTDAAGNTGTGTTDSNNYAIDTLRPTASIVVADTALAAGETSLVTITFNEAVSGLALGDFTV